MDEVYSVINKLMVEVFNDVLAIEENALRLGTFSDVSVTEVHTVEAIGMYAKKTAGEVAKKLNVTAGTLSVAVNKLVRKNYVTRLRSEDDRRVVKLGLTEKGRLLFRVHKAFHSEMIREAVTGLNKQEEKVLAEAFRKLHAYLQSKLG